MRRWMFVPLLLAPAFGLAGCVASDGPPPGSFRPGLADYGGCAPLNIGTPDNPRYIKDPACGRS